MAEKNKDRVYVAIYFQGDGRSQNPDYTPNRAFGHSRFHWAILVQKKDAGDDGTFFQVVYEEKGAAAAWTYTNYISGVKRSQRLLGRFLVGKCPSSITIEDIDAALQKNVDLPKIDAKPLQNCVTWTQQALALLQRMKCVKGFDINEFFDFATAKGDEWMGKGAFEKRGGSDKPEEDYYSRH